MKSLLALLCMSSIACAEISIGADIMGNFSDSSFTIEPSSESYTGSTIVEKVSQNSLSIAPMIGIFPSKLVEIAPFFRWSVTSSSYDVKVEGSSTTSEPATSSQHSIEPGCGVYFHVVNNNNLLDFSLGPKLAYSWFFKPNNKDIALPDYDKYYKGSLNFGIQTNIDLKFTEHFKARFFSNLFRISILNTHTQKKGSTIKIKESKFVSDFKTILQPAFGFHFTF